MKTTRLFGPGFLSLLVALAPACKVVVDDTPDDESGDSGGDETTTTEDDEADASGEATTSDSSDGEDAGTTDDETTSSEITLTGDTEDAAAVVADAVEFPLGPDDHAAALIRAVVNFLRRKLAAVVPPDLDHAAIGQQSSFHEKSLPSPAT